MARVLRLAADLRLEQDELGEALPLLMEAHQLDKSDVDTALLLGLLAIDLDRLETAASALRVSFAMAASAESTLYVCVCVCVCACMCVYMYVCVCV